MGERELSRRKLLAAAAGAGGLGAVVGPGTASFFSDTERAQDSTLRSGQLDLLVTWETDDGQTGTSENGKVPDTLELTPSDASRTVDLTVSLPPRDGANNAALVWLGTPCPDETAFTRNVEVTLRVKYCDDCQIYSGSLWGLVQGVSLDPGNLHPDIEDGCLPPGRQIPLELEVGVDDYSGVAGVDLPFRFVGTQCRNTRTETNPFVPLEEECAPAAAPSDGIDFVSFCSRAGEDVGPTITTRRSNDEGEPVSIVWYTDLPVDYVILKAGTRYTVYDYLTDNSKNGTARAGADGAEATTLDAPAGYASEPCALPATELGHEAHEFASSEKYVPAGSGWEGDD